jgi:hypothetical protein
MTRKQWLILLGIAMVALTIVPVFLFEKRLEHTGGPGILAFEFAATKARASQILAEWGPKGRHTARLSLIVDYAYMISYGGFSRSPVSLRGTSREHVTGGAWPQRAWSSRSSPPPRRCSTPPKTCSYCSSSKVTEVSTPR